MMIGDVEDIAFCIFLRHTFNDKIHYSYGHELSDLAHLLRQEWDGKSDEDKLAFIDQARTVLYRLEKYFYGR